MRRLLLTTTLNIRIIEVITGHPALALISPLKSRNLSEAILEKR